MSMSNIVSGNQLTEKEKEALRNSGFIDSEGNITEIEVLGYDPATITGADVITKTPFYYDQVLMKTLTSVSLHANTELDENGEWVVPKGLTDDEGYLVQHLIKAPFVEDYNVGMKNEWTEFGDDALGGFFNTIKPYAPYLGHLAKMVGKMNITEDRMKFFNDPDANTNFYNIVNSITDHIAESATKGSKILNRSLVSQGARFSYYSGTGTSFGNLSMKFTVFSGWKLNYDTGETEWKTVDDQLQNLYPYLIGKYTKGILNSSDGTIQGTDISTGVKGENAELINEFLSWQLPPAGYTPETKSLDNVMFGTLKLKFGTFYSLSSLLCTNAQFNFSKQMAKQWDGTKNILSPLYCDVVINFQPATKYSDESMKRFISGQTMKTEVQTVKNGLGKKLQAEKDKNQRFLRGEGL